MVGVIALCVDYSLKYLVDCEVQRSADAAAIAGAQRILGDEEIAEPTPYNVLHEAQLYGAKNQSTGAQFTFLPGDIEVGWWDPESRAFWPEALIENINAVRATITRSKQRGDAIETSIAPLIGISDLHSSRTATACLRSVPNYALIGADAFTSYGVLSVTGTDGPGSGNVASNDSVRLNVLGLVGVTWIDGHVATQGSVEAPLIGTLTKIRDGIKRPKHRFVLPAISSAQVESSNDNAKLGSALDRAGNLTIAGPVDVFPGTYCVNSASTLPGSLLRIHGPVCIFVKGNVSFLGTVACLNSTASSLKIRVVGPGCVTLAANLSIAADLYAPGSDITVGAGVLYSGRLIGKTITVLGTSFFVLYNNLPQPELGQNRAILVR